MTFAAAEVCSNMFFRFSAGHGKSPCFSRWALRCSGNVDGAVSVFAVLDVDVSAR
jgi:hypothetical protein